MGLDRELDTFRKHLPDMLREHRSEWVLIRGDQVDSFWTTEAEAAKEGDRKFLLQSFLIKQVVENEKPIISLVPVVPRCRS